MTGTRAKLVAALAKPIAGGPDPQIHDEVFDPWNDLISGIHGSYSEESDHLMIASLKAVRDRTTFEFIEEYGFAAEFALYVLSGHGLTEYGTSPRGGWPEPEIEDLWDDLISKWENYSREFWRKSN